MSVEVFGVTEFLRVALLSTEEGRWWILSIKIAQQSYFVTVMEVKMFANTYVSVP